MTVPDFRIPVAAMQIASAVDVPGSYCDQQGTAVLRAFDGADLLARLLGLPANLVQALALCTSAPTSEALTRRGYVVVNTVGRVGVTVGYGRVLEPCGRLYAITHDPATRWAAAYLPSTLARTIQ